MKDLPLMRLAGIAALLIAGVVLLVARSRIRSKNHEEETPSLKKHRRLMLMAAVLLLWLGCGLAIGMFYHSSGGGFHVDMLAPRINILGFSVSSSVVIGWGAMVIVIVPALIIRIFVIPKFKDKADGVQAVLETIVGYLTDYTKEKTGFVSEPLNAYIMTVSLFLIGCAVMELFSFRPPTADIVTTFSLSLITFFMINYFGIKKKGFKGRIASFAKPLPIVFPFRILSDVVIPVSLACRLFGNMMGGMIVIHLVYMALGAFGVGIPAVVGLYFNAFHPLIQVFIFITLSLTFIGESVE